MAHAGTAIVRITGKITAELQCPNLQGASFSDLK